MSQNSSIRSLIGSEDTHPSATAANDHAGSNIIGGRDDSGPDSKAANAEITDNGDDTVEDAASEVSVEDLDVIWTVTHVMDTPMMPWLGDVRLGTDDGEGASGCDGENRTRLLLSSRRTRHHSRLRMLPRL